MVRGTISDILPIAVPVLGFRIFGSSKWRSSSQRPLPRWGAAVSYLANVAWIHDGENPVIASSSITTVGNEVRPVRRRIVASARC